MLDWYCPGAALVLHWYFTRAVLLRNRGYTGTVHVLYMSCTCPVLVLHNTALLLHWI